jgi:protocatechuate 3,4-dioxygenase beta subunit
MKKLLMLFLLLSLALIVTACTADVEDSIQVVPIEPEVLNTPVDEVVPETGMATPETVEPEVVIEPTLEAAAESIPEAAPSCTSPATLTPAAAEGPFYTPGSPERSSMVDDLPGTRLILTGYVLDTDCQPVPGAWIDFWQTDSQGVYDNVGYTLRGHQYTDEDGRYTLESVVPGQYPGRTQHLHVKVQAPDGPVLTSQLYFPSADQNQSDRLFDQNLLIEITAEAAGEIQATYDFVINR